MRGIYYRILALIFPLSLRLALPSDYKTWYGSAKNSFSRGKSTYDELVKSAQNSEDECVILHSTDNRLSTTQGAGRGTGTESGSFPCLDHLQHKDNRSNFDINFNIGDVAGGSREERLVAEGGCWQFVLNQVSALDIDRCDVKGEVSRSLIALAKTKCHLIRSGRTFPLAEHGCLLNPDVLDDNALGLLGDQYTSNPCRSVYNSGECEKLKEDIVAQCTNPRVMTEAAFQMYHADLNHIDDICFYLQSNEWNRRTESNINRLGESAVNLLNTQQNMEIFLAGMQKQQEESLRKATRLTSWMDALRDDLKDVFNILETINSYQYRIYAFVHSFKLFFEYALYVAAAIAVTIFEATAWARPRIVLTVVASCLADAMAFKAITRSAALHRLGYSKEDIYGVASSAIRWIAVTLSVYMWIRAVLTYQPPAQAMLKEMHQIRKILTPRIVYPNVRPNTGDSDATGDEDNSPRGYTLDDFVELFGERSDSTYTYESGYTTEESSDGSLGEDSEGLVEEYLETQSRRRRRTINPQRVTNYRRI